MAVLMLQKELNLFVRKAGIRANQRHDPADVQKERLYILTKDCPPDLRDDLGQLLLICGGLRGARCRRIRLSEATKQTSRRKSVAERSESAAAAG